MPMHEAAQALSPGRHAARRHRRTRLRRRQQPRLGGKGHRPLLGVRAVLAESFERIHRTNLVALGVIPLQFHEGDSAESLGLDGTETYTIRGLAELGVGAARDGRVPPGRRAHLRVHRAARRPGRRDDLSRGRPPADGHAPAGGVAWAHEPRRRTRARGRRRRGRLGAGADADVRVRRPDGPSRRSAGRSCLPRYGRPRCRPRCGCATSAESRSSLAVPGPAWPAGRFTVGGGVMICSDPDEADPRGEPPRPGYAIVELGVVNVWLIAVAGRHRLPLRPGRRSQAPARSAATSRPTPAARTRSSTA